VVYTRCESNPMFSHICSPYHVLTDNELRLLAKEPVEELSRSYTPVSATTSPTMDLMIRYLDRPRDLSSFVAPKHMLYPYVYIYTYVYTLYIAVSIVVHVCFLLVS